MSRTNVTILSITWNAQKRLGLLCKSCNLPYVEGICDILVNSGFHIYLNIIAKCTLLITIYIKFFKVRRKFLSIISYETFPTKLLAIITA